MFHGIDLKRLAVHLLIVIAAVMLPAYLISKSNEKVFPSTLEMANGMILITVMAAIAAMIVASHEAADNRARFVASAGEIILAALLFFNLVGHWQLAREVSGAESAEREAKEKRDELNKLADAENARQIEATKANSQLLAQFSAAAKSEQQRLAAASENCRITRNCQAAKTNLVLPSLPAVTGAGSKISPATVQAAVTMESVRASWNPSLSWRAYVETGAAVLLLVLLGVLWNADFDGDGLKDRIQRLNPSVMRRLYPEIYQKQYPKGAPGVDPLPAVAGALSESAPGRRIGFSGGGAEGAQNQTANRPLAGTSAPTSAPTSAAMGMGAARSQSAPIRRAGQTYDVIGILMPAIENVEWEGKSSKGVIVAGWLPRKLPGDRRAPRLGQFGKRRLEELGRLPQAERFHAIRQQIEEWKQASGVTND